MTDASNLYIVLFGSKVQFHKSRVVDANPGYVCDGNCKYLPIAQVIPALRAIEIAFVTDWFMQQLSRDRAEPDSSSRVYAS